MEYLITSTLLDAWKYLFTEYGKLEDFLTVLNRKKTETTKAQEEGFIFEDWAIENYEPTLNGQYQVKLSKPIVTKNAKYLLYGRLDCLKNGKIYDFKHTSSYEMGKFYGRCQTSAYLELVPEASEMVYVIGKDKPAYMEDGEPYIIYTEEYKRDEIEPIKDIICDFEEWLKSMGLWQTYTEKWETRGE